jgi:hypothetical protein
MSDGQDKGPKDLAENLNMKLKILTAPRAHHVEENHHVS